MYRYIFNFWECTSSPIFRQQTQSSLILVLSYILLKQINMDQISIKTPNPKCRLFLKIDLTAGVYMSDVPYPPSSPVTHCMNTCTPVLYLSSQGRGCIALGWRFVDWPLPIAATRTTTRGKNRTRRSRVQRNH
jgi:hypothetical protein